MSIFDFLRLKSSQALPQAPTQQIQSPLFPGSDRAIVSQTITTNHRGRIYYQNTYWFGCSLNDAHISEGTVVKVLERHGTTWLVQPINYCETGA